MKAVFFSTQAKWRAWLQKNHNKEPFLWVGFHRKATGKASITWPQSVDEALCFGWIDGLRKGIDTDSYMIRFSPRQPGSIWSQVNAKRVGELKKLGLMHESGLEVFKTRDKKKALLYSSEQRDVPWPPKLQREFESKKAAWDFFRAQPPGYQKTLIWWVVSAKREETQRKRLARVIEVSARSTRVDLESPFRD